jgi:nicotinamide-nucleotide amidase
MDCEVVAIGTELLLGQVIDTNSSWIGEQLALVGISCRQQTKIGDNPERMVVAIRDALDRADAVVCCGGLGPTQDDITREALARVMGVELELDEDRADVIRWMFRGRDRRMPENNLLQAYKPVGAEFLETQPGTAPGLRCEIGDKVIYAVPGVPWEMKQMMAADILPDLQRRAGISSVIRSRTFRTWGESESGLAERLADRFAELDAVGNPTIAFLASGAEGLKVRVTAKAETETAALDLLAVEETYLRGLLGEYVFGIDDETMESVVLDLLRSRGQTLAVAESLTGGLLASRLVGIAGASDVFVGGVVAYDSKVKFDLLGVPEGPVITEETARAMALGVRKLLGADVGLATTGVAGPTDQEGKSPGTVCFAVAVGDEVTTAEVRLPGERTLVRELSVITVLSALRQRLITP